MHIEVSLKGYGKYAGILTPQISVARLYTVERQYLYAVALSKYGHVNRVLNLTRLKQALQLTPQFAVNILSDSIAYRGLDKYRGPYKYSNQRLEKNQQLFFTQH